MDEGYRLSDTLRFHLQIDGLNWQFGGEKMLYNFLHRSEFLPHAVVYRHDPVVKLEEAPRQEIAHFRVQSQLGPLPLDEYVRIAPVNGLLVLHHGRIVYECYPRMRPFDRHALMSVTKPLVSLLIALLEARGMLDSAQTVERYLPEVAGSGWEGVRLQDVLDMASGIAAPEVMEGFTNPDHPYYQYEASLGWLPPTRRTRKSTYRYVASLPRRDPPGLAYDYTSVNTFLLAWLAERLTGLPLSEILSREIWCQIGAEADALLSISKYGAPAAHGGLSAALRDVARFGLLFTESARSVLPASLLPPGYLDKIQHGGRPQLFDRGDRGPEVVRSLHGEHPRHNVDQWDYVLEDGDFFKGGYGGQGLYISPRRDLVIAYFGTPFDESLQAHELKWITRQMIHAGLFDG